LLVLLIRIWAKMPPLKRLTGPRIPPHILAEERWLEGQADAGLFLAQARALGLTPPSPPPYGGEADIIRMARVLYGQVGQHRRMAWPTALLAGLGQAAKLTVTRLWLKRVGPVRYRKLIAGPGAMVAFTGSDGSGKSTQTQLLLKWLHYKLDAHLLYMGSGDGSTGLANGFRKSLSRLWKKTKGSKPKTPSTSGRPASLAEKIWRLFDLLLLRRKVRLLRKARRMADRGSVMLIDRYPQSQFPGISDGARQQDGRGFAWAAAMERRLLAEAAGLGPDLVLKLHISPEAAHARKPDHDLATIRRKCDVVDSLAFPDARVVVLDAGEPLDQVTLAAKAAVWTHIQKAQGHGH
jgi:thymidylate kinase